MEKHSPEPSAAALRQIDSPPRSDILMAVRLNAVEVASRRSWSELFYQRVDPHYRRYSPLEPGRTEREVRASLLRLLDGRDFATISEIWSQSDFITDAELLPTKPRKPLTRHSISRRMFELAQETGVQRQLR